MVVEITQEEELSSMISRLYWVESQLELSSEWEGYFMAKDQKHRDILFRISHDSEAHRSIIKLLSHNLKGIELKKDLEGFKDPGFNFRKLHVEEVMAEIMRYETIAHDLYSRMYSSTSKDLVKSIWRGDEPEHYFKLLNWLVGQEKAHMKLLEPYAGQIERIY